MENWNFWSKIQTVACLRYILYISRRSSARVQFKDMVLCYLDIISHTCMSLVFHIWSIPLMPSEMDVHFRSTREKRMHLYGMYQSSEFCKTILHTLFVWNINTQSRLKISQGLHLSVTIEIGSHCVGTIRNSQKNYNANSLSLLCLFNNGIWDLDLGTDLQHI